MSGPSQAVTPVTIGIPSWGTLDLLWKCTSTVLLIYSKKQNSFLKTCVCICVIFNNYFCYRRCFKILFWIVEHTMIRWRTVWTFSILLFLRFSACLIRPHIIVFRMLLLLSVCLSVFNSLIDRFLYSLSRWWLLHYLRSSLIRSLSSYRIRL